MNMKSRAMHVVLLSVLSCAVFAAPQLEVGKVLSGKELATLSRTPVEVGGKVLQVVSSGTAVMQTRSTSQSTVIQPTWVVNGLGAVGRSFNEVVVGGVPTDAVKQSLSALGKSVVTSQYFDATHVSVLRFGSFADAVAAQTKLKELLPEAQVSVPIEYSKKQPR